VVGELKGYREIPEDRILKFPATPRFKGWESFFTDESVTHPAKMNLNLLRWILETYTSEGDVVLDPMAGTGSTIILAALMGRHGVAVEYETRFCDMIRANIRLTERQATLTPKGGMTCIHGDAQELSKLLEESNTIITSPPYGNRLSDTAVHDGDPARMGYRQTVEAVLTSPPYGSDNANLMGRKDKSALSVLSTTGMRSVPLEEGNIGNLESESYLQAILQVYRECQKVLKPEGVMIIVVKNFIRDKKVVRLDLDTIKLCEAAGFRLADRWYFRLPTRSFWRILYRRKYPNVPEVEYEDVLIFEKSLLKSDSL
jgi:DNA modification methylase